MMEEILIDRWYMHLSQTRRNNGSVQNNVAEWCGRNSNGFPFPETLDASPPLPAMDMRLCIWSVLVGSLCNAWIISASLQESVVTSQGSDPIAEERHRILVVKKGRTAYLNPRVLLETPPPDGTCMVQVVHNDPMTQRVGKLTPQVRWNKDVDE